MKDKLYNYGNTEAHNLIKKLMLRGENLTIGFFNEDITNYSCAWIESKTVSAFKYVIFKADNFYWLMVKLRTLMRSRLEYRERWKKRKTSNYVY